jgi:DNA-binding response OmpR family regulator
MCAELLQTHGYEVIQAALMAEAQRQLAADTVKLLDMAIIDLGLPDGNGGQLAWSLRARRPIIPILILSGNVDAEHSNILSGMPGIQYLSKPYQSLDLIRIVSASLQVKE